MWPCSMWFNTMVLLVLIKFRLLVHWMKICVTHDFGTLGRVSSLVQCLTWVASMLVWSRSVILLANNMPLMIIDSPLLCNISLAEPRCLFVKLCHPLSWRHAYDDYRFSSLVQYVTWGASMLVWSRSVIHFTKTWFWCL